MSDDCNKSAEVNGGAPFTEARGWTAEEVVARAKRAVTEYCRTGMKPAGRSEMYRDCVHACLDQLRAHMEKPSNGRDQRPGEQNL